jgi:putative ATP-dependent endonuclease of the OLD family
MLNEERQVFIEKMDIENYRSIQRASVSLDDVSAFVGRNGVGKSTLLYALDTFYNVGAQYSLLDYYNHQIVDATIRIQVTFGGLRENERIEFGSYVQNDKLIVTKIINQGGARYFGTVPQIPDFADLRKLGAADKRRRLQELVTAGSLPGFPDIPRKSEDVDRVMAEYELGHAELTRPIERETQFLGPRNVGGGTLDKFTKFVLVPAVRDANTELERRGAIMQLLDLIVTRSITNRNDFQEFKRQFEERARQLYGKDNLPELSELGRLITERLKRYAPGSELSIDFGDLKAPTIPLPDAVVTVSEDNFKVPVRYSGHGLQRALILALLEQLSMTPIPTTVATEAQGVDSVAGAVEMPRIPDLILAIEEPELYLHPARSRYLSKILQDLARRGSDLLQPLIQVIYVTHSPYFVDVEHFDQVRMCRKVLAGAGDPPTTRFTSYSRSRAAQRLAEITGRPAGDFTARSFVTRAAPVLNSLVNEGLFADIVVVVEGDSDLAALWTMQAILRKKWEEIGVVVVPAGGKNNIDRIVVVLEGFGIPTYFSFDGDKSEGEGAKANRILLGLGGEQIVDYPSDFVGHKCAAFAEDIEDHLRASAGDQFSKICALAKQRTEYAQSGEALKNPEVMAAFIRGGMEMGIQFPQLSGIVEAVSKLVRH